MKSDKLTFGILGGDKRNYYLAKALKNDVALKNCQI